MKKSKKRRVARRRSHRAAIKHSQRIEARQRGEQARHLRERLSRFMLTE